jgi:hypothetical protein
MLDSLAQTPPRLILDTSTSSKLGYSKYPTSLIPDLDQLIHSEYRQLAIVDGVTVWQRIA